MAHTVEVIIKQGLMKKRSQNKKIYTPVNYKVRWFVLTRKYFIYYDIENEEVCYYYFYFTFILFYYFF